MVDQTKVKDIFVAALDHPEDQRIAFLDGACGSDSALRKAVETLLAALEEKPVLETAPLRSLDADVAPSKKSERHTRTEAEAPGARIGPYKLLQLIGEGGFGAVFMAEQQQPVRRRVALKIIKLGMDTRQVVARFE